MSNTVKNVFLSAVALAVSVLVAEFFFLHYTKSDGVGVRWSHALWYRNFFEQNRIEYTDLHGVKQTAEFRGQFPELNSSSKYLLFVGDSFTGADGIDSMKQSFVGLIDSALPIGYATVNLGERGADSYREMENVGGFFQQPGMKEIPKPKMVVWQYYGNDIEYTAGNLGLYAPKDANSSGNESGLSSSVFKGKSFLLDYIYWEYLYSYENNYSSFLASVFDLDSVTVNGRVLKDSVGYLTPYKIHLSAIKEIRERCRISGIPFCIAIFPFLWDGGPEQANELYGKRIEEEFRKEGTDVINLCPLLVPLPTKNRCVNSHNPHPSPLVHQIAADTILRLVVQRMSL